MRAAVLAVVLVAATHVAHADVAITKVGVKVKADGKKWDAGFVGTDPDPQIDVYVDGERIQECPQIKDAFAGDCAVATDLAYRKAVEIELRVVDRDIASDDPIGHAGGTVPADMHGRFDLRVDGQLEAAWIDVEYRDPPGAIATLKKHVGVRSIGALVGVLLALLLFKIYGTRLLSPPDVKRTVPPRAAVLTKSREEYDEGHDGEDEQAREYVHVEFWRSPILLASAAASIVGIVLANLLRSPALPLWLGALPYVLGGFGFTAPIIDAHAHKHLGGKRLRLVIAGVAAMFAVPLYDFARDLFTGVSFLAKHLGWTFVGILIFLCLL